ncbi:MAG: ABC transporter ATP-binding protein, partial [Thermoplasmata archaeon]|nr:ABC transporter ATP-binding protein [Thermoplasmata archaeon]
MQFERHAMSNSRFVETVDIVREMISEAGFGIVSEIDISANILQSMGEVFKPYLILGACMPKHAARGLEARPELGV